jgi:hypothetical protein
MACGQLPLGGCWLPVYHNGPCIDPDTAKRVIEIVTDAIELYRLSLPPEASRDRIVNGAGRPRSRDDMSWALAQARDIVSGHSVYLPRTEKP